MGPLSGWKIPRWLNYLFVWFKNACLLYNRKETYIVSTVGLRAEKVEISMAESVVSSLVLRLADLLSQEAVFLDEVREEVENMRKELVRMQSFLRDADKRQDEEESVRNWVSEIRDAAYDVEDIVEDYAFKFALRKGTGVVNAVKRYAALAKDTFELHRVGSEIQSIQKRMSNLRSSLQTYGIIPRNEDSSRDHAGIGRQQQKPLLRRSYSHMKQDDIVGLEQNVKTLVDQLVRSDRKFVCVYGMGGLGKTTLAKKVYHDKGIRQHFDAFAWAYISQQCQRRDVWEGVLVKLKYPFPSTEQREEIQKLKDDELAKMLYQVQSEKKCLVILDDIWSIETWNKLCPAFPGERSGSKIVITTRNRDVALHPDPTCFLLKPRYLNDDESWELFKKKTFFETSCHGNFAPIFLIANHFTRRFLQVLQILYLDFPLPVTK